MSYLLTPYRPDRTFFNRDHIEMASIVDAHNAWVFDCYKADAGEILRRINGLSKNNYPESVIRMNEYLEKTLELHKAEIESANDRIHALLWDVRILSQIKAAENEGDRTVWHWQHDGYDYLRSMPNDQAVLISAEDLRDLLENGERVME